MIVGSIRDCVVAQRRPRRDVVVWRPQSPAEARNEQALRALHCNGKAMGSWRAAHLATRSFGQCSGSAKGRMGDSAARRPEDTRQLLVFLVAGPVYPGRSSRDSVAASRFVTTRPCAAECVHCKIPSSSAQTMGTFSHSATTARLRRLDRPGRRTCIRCPSACSCSALRAYQCLAGYDNGNTRCLLL